LRNIENIQTTILRKLNTDHQHHLVERADDQKNSYKMAMFAGMTVGQLCANWMSSGWGSNPNPPTSPKPPFNRPTPRSKQIFSTSTNRPGTIYESTDDGSDDCHLFDEDEDTEDESSSDHIDHDYIDQYNERMEEQNRRHRGSSTQMYHLATLLPTTPAPRPGPSNDRQRPSKRPSVDGHQGGAPDPKRPRPQNEAQGRRPHENPANGIHYPLNPYARIIPMAVITYQNLMEVEAALAEVERRILATNTRLTSATDDFAREVSYYNRRWVILNYNRERFTQEAKDNLRTRCNARRRVHSDQIVNHSHDLSILRHLRQSLYQQQNAFRLGLLHIASFAGGEMPHFDVVINWDNVAVVRAQVTNNSLFHRPRREDMEHYPHEISTVHNMEDYHRELFNITPNVFKIISFEDSTPFLEKSARFHEQLRTLRNLYWAFKETLFGWHQNSQWYTDRTISLIQTFTTLVNALRTNLNPSNIDERYIWVTELENLISSKINRKLLWYNDPVACLDDLEKFFKFYEAKADLNKTFKKIMEHHNELKRRSDVIT